MSNIPEWVEAEEKKQILKQQQQDSIEALKAKMDKKAELLVLERRMQMERVETEMEEQLRKERDKVFAAKEKLDGEQRLATEISRLRREEEREKKVREQLRNTSGELKELEIKLRAAYVRKQLTAQIAEKEAIAAQEKLEKQKIQEMLEAENRCMEEQKQQKEDILQAEKLKYREELLNQIKEGNKKQQDAERDLILEKALLEQAMRKFYEDQEKEKHARLERLTKVKQEIEEFQKQKEIRKQHEKTAKEEEEKRIKAYADEREKEEEIRVQVLKEKEAIKDKIKNQITISHLSKLQAASEREDILAGLAEEDIRLRDLKKDKEKEEAKKKLKEDFIKAIKENLEEKETTWKSDYQEQERYRYHLLDDTAKQEKLDRSSVGNKAVKSKELRESLQHQMMEKHKRQVEEWQRESALRKLAEVEEKERMRIVEEERLRMLKTHSPKLAGYLPRGVLLQNDLKHFGPEFLDKLSKHNANNV